MSHVNKIRSEHLECFEMLLTPKSLSPQLAKVQEVCKNSESMSKELEERLIQKYEAYEENRNNQLQSVVKRLQDHVRILEIFISIHINSFFSSPSNCFLMVFFFEQSLK